MSKVMITESYLEDIADAIRTKNGSSDTYKPAEMADAIEAIPGGITPTGTISITQNGTVDVTQYASADVNVPSVTPTGTINITQNGTVDVTNYASASVAVPNPSTGTKQISITQNGTTTENVTDYASAEIAVNVPTGPFTLLFEKTIALGEYTNTSTAETTDTGFNIRSYEYEQGVYVITCDSAITTSTEWGMTIGSWARTWNANSNTTGKLMIPYAGALQQKGTATLLQSLITVSPANSNYGVYLVNDQLDIKIVRKANSNMPKLRAGNYTLKFYALTSL